MNMVAVKMDSGYFSRGNMVGFLNFSWQTMELQITINFYSITNFQHSIEDIKIKSECAVSSFERCNIDSWEMVKFQHREGNTWVPVELFVASCLRFLRHVGSTVISHRGHVFLFHPSVPFRSRFRLAAKSCVCKCSRIRAKRQLHIFLLPDVCTVPTYVYSSFYSASNPVERGVSKGIRVRSHMSNQRRRNDGGEIEILKGALPIKYTKYRLNLLRHPFDSKAILTVRYCKNHEY